MSERFLLGTATSSTWSDISVFVDEEGRIFVNGLVSSAGVGRDYPFYDEEQAVSFGELMVRAGTVSAQVKKAAHDREAAQKSYNQLYLDKIQSLVEGTDPK